MLACCAISCVTLIIDKIYYQSNHLWKGQATVKKLAELIGEKPKAVKQWLSRQFDPKANAEIFKDFYSNLANDLVKKLPNPPNKYGKDAVKKYYENLNLVGKSFSFEPVAHTSVLKLLQQLNPHKSTGIDNLTGKFLKEGAPVLASPITNLINLSITLSSFPDDCKIAKLKPLYKKEAKTKPKNY